MGMTTYRRSTVVMEHYPRRMLGSIEIRILISRVEVAFSALRIPPRH